MKIESYINLIKKKKKLKNLHLPHLYSSKKNLKKDIVLSTFVHVISNA